MKKVIFSAIIIAFILVSCNPKNEKAASDDSATEATEKTEATPTAETTESTEVTSELYACSMHNEITGKKGEKCSKCGMELTEPVAK
ncbi:MAG TPA: heavy metal-binding domain-containing protein [Flavobacterium sp.]|nr:heavy metal-binding domain-containing protein [Flavobacterium sp.]